MLAYVYVVKHSLRHDTIFCKLQSRDVEGKKLNFGAYRNLKAYLHVFILQYVLDALPNTVCNRAEPFDSLLLFTTRSHPRFLLFHDTLTLGLQTPSLI